MKFNFGIKKTHSFWKKVLKKDNEDPVILAVFTLAIFWGLIIGRTGIGMRDANRKNKCIVESFSDIAIAPFYAIGCNLSKKRFKWKVN